MLFLGFEHGFELAIAKRKKGVAVGQYAAVHETTRRKKRLTIQRSLTIGTGRRALLHLYLTTGKYSSSLGTVME
jgi:hypothetical protein